MDGKDIGKAAAAAVVAFVAAIGIVFLAGVFGILVYWGVVHIILEIAQLVGLVTFEPHALGTLPLGVGVWGVAVIIKLIRG